eukprot:2178938-Pleurochrysis_carterae.AAC.1
MHDSRKATYQPPSHRTYPQACAEQRSYVRVMQSLLAYSATRSARNDGCKFVSTTSSEGRRKPHGTRAAASDKASKTRGPP